MDIKIPKLILQPFVENSLYHGIRLKGEKGIIKISVYKNNGKLFISVFDNGIGMNKEKIQSILNKDEKKSFGIKGTIERIMYYYEEKDIYEIKSEEGTYCEVIIMIPL